MQTQNPEIRILLKLAMQKPVVTTALKIGFIVGTILNLINQGHVLTAPDFSEKLALGKLILTYCVPYLVSTYSSIATLRHLEKEDKAPSETSQPSSPAVSS